MRSSESSLRPNGISSATRLPWLLLGGVSLVYAVTIVLAGRAKLLWFDELATLSTATQPTWHRLLQSEVADANPPIIYLLTRLCLDVFGQNQFAVRLPELMGMLLTGVCCFVFVRRTLDWPAGLLAACAFFFGHAGPYAVEARPYGLLAGFCALMLVYWQASARREPGLRRAALAGLALSGFAVNLTHPYGILYAFFPIFAGEAVRSYRNHRIDWPVIAASLIGFTGQMVALPLAIETRHSLLGHLPPGGIPVAYPAIQSLWASFAGQVEAMPYLLIFPFAFVALWVGWKSSRERSGEETKTTADPYWNDLAAAGGLAAMVVLVWCFSWAVTHYYFDRYGTPASAGVAMFAVLLLRKLPARTTAALALSLSITFQGWRNLRQLATMWRQEPLDIYLFAPSIPEEPILVSSALAFTQEYWYANPEQRKRLHFVADAQKALQMDDFIPELNILMQSERGLLPYRAEKLDDFLAQHKSFLLLNDRHFLTGHPLPADEWVPEELRRRGYRFRRVLDDIPGYNAVIEQVTAPGDQSAAPK